MHFGVLNYEKQHKEGTCKVLGRSVVFSAFYADFCFCSKLVIITTLNIYLSFIVDGTNSFEINKDRFNKRGNVSDALPLFSYNQVDKFDLLYLQSEECQCFKNRPDRCS